MQPNSVSDSATADRPAFSDRGDSAMPGPGARRHKSAAQMSDEELIAESGLEPIFSTTEAAEFFDRSNQWLYWGLREGVFLDEHGEAITPERIGSEERGRRRFTIPILRDIMNSSYRRGNMDSDHLKVVLRRIKLAEEGVEWRALEGWRHVHLGRNRHKWVRPEKAYYDELAGEWRERADDGE